MAQQARRIKKKPAAETKAARKPLNLPWGLMLVILVCGVVLGMLLNGAQTGDGSLGAGLKELLKPEQAEQETDQAIADLINNESADQDADSGVDLDFYEVLPDIDQVMPDDLPDASPARPDANLDYYLQAASFRKQPDAEKLRARLALKGFKSVTQARTSEENGTFYRVRLGPYGDRRKAKTAKNKLQRLGVRPFVYSVKKNAQ